MRPTEDEIDALNDLIRRLRAELERVREAGRAVAEEWAHNNNQCNDDRVNDAISALEAALEGEEGK